MNLSEDRSEDRHLDEMAQKQLEEERLWKCLTIFQKAERSGLFTDEELKHLRFELAL